MDALVLLGFFSIIFSLGYLVFHFTKRIRDKDRVISKKILYPTLIGGFILFVVGVGASDTEAQPKLDDALIQNETLLESIEVLETENNELKDKIVELESSFKKEISELESELKEANSTIDDYEAALSSIENQSEEIKLLEQEIESLTSENEELKSEISSLESKVASAESSSSSSSSSVSSTSSSGGTQSTSSNSSTSSSASGDCDIKGSKSGIYHVPGSTYYSRTTNVVRWFCSVEEAQNAGYRAPKR